MAKKFKASFGIINGNTLVITETKNQDPGSILLDDIVLLQSGQRYVQIIGKKGKLFETRFGITALMKQLQGAGFVQNNRTQAINSKYIKGFNDDYTRTEIEFIGWVSIARNRKEEFYDL